MNHYKNNPTHVLLKNKDKKINNITNTIKKKNNSTTTHNTTDATDTTDAHSNTLPNDKNSGLIIRGITQHKLKKDISIESLLE